jgi:hypothetical protein
MALRLPERLVYERNASLHTNWLRILKPGASFYVTRTLLVQNTLNTGTPEITPQKLVV